MLLTHPVFSPSRRLSFIGLLIYASVIYHRFRIGTLKDYENPNASEFEADKLMPASRIPSAQNSESQYLTTAYTSPIAMPETTYDTPAEKPYYDAPTQGIAPNEQRYN